jgi:hypothetical protein
VSVDLLGFVEERFAEIAEVKQVQHSRLHLPHETAPELQLVGALGTTKSVERDAASEAVSDDPLAAGFALRAALEPWVAGTAWRNTLAGAIVDVPPVSA